MELPIIRIRYEKQGGHYHCRLFTAPEPDRTFAKCGDLVFDEREWPLIKQKLAQSVEFIDTVEVEHCCGVSGFAGSGDVCPRCELNARMRTANALGEAK